MEYVKATVEVVEFNNEDIITTSAKDCNGKVHTALGTHCHYTQAAHSSTTDGTQW